MGTSSLRVGYKGDWVEGGYTFLSLFFSAVSSLPALAAWRFSCLAVNFRLKSDFSRPDIAVEVEGVRGGVETSLRMGTWMLRLVQVVLKRYLEKTGTL